MTDRRDQLRQDFLTAINTMIKIWARGDDDAMRGIVLCSLRGFAFDLLATLDGHYPSSGVPPMILAPLDDNVGLQVTSNIAGQLPETLYETFATARAAPSNA